MNRTIEDIISERDDLIGDISKKDHNISKSDNYSNIKNSILRSVIVNTPLSDAFFSDKNIYCMSLYFTADKFLIFGFPPRDALILKI